MHWFHELKFFLAAGIFAAAGAMSAADAPEEFFQKTAPAGPRPGLTALPVLL